MDDGRVIFVPGVAVGELVSVELSETRNDFGKARLINVVEASEDRRQPPCPHVADGCGGCDWQHITPAAQGAAKLAIVTEAFSRTAKMAVEPRLRSLPDSARRTTVRMASTSNGVLGFREGESNRIVPVSECMVAHPLINELIANPLFEGEGEATIRVGARTGDRAVWVHEGKPLPLADGIARGNRGVITEVVNGNTYTVSNASFWQSSPEAAELIIDSITKRLNAVHDKTRDVWGGRLVDAYGGVGLFSLAFADRFDDLMLVESNEFACRDALVNLADCAATIEQCNFEHWDIAECNVLIADPARQGLGKGGAATIAECEAPTVVLVSCDPVSAARDARLLVDAGYDLGDVDVLDIFPETHHVEVVSIFTLRD